MKARRKFTRVECNMNVLVQIDNVMFLEANILNISLKGAFFKFADYCVFKKGDKWDLKFKLPNFDFNLQFEIEVTHSHNHLVGVKFVHMDIETMQHLRSLIEGRISNPEEIERELELLN